MKRLRPKWEERLWRLRISGVRAPTSAGSRDRATTNIPTPAAGSTADRPQRMEDQFPVRQRLIRGIEAHRGRRLVCYLTSTRGLSTALMGPEAIPIIYRHLVAMELDRNNDGLDLLLHTSGGESVVPWQLMNLLREFAKDVHLLVPHYAYSAGTLTALGADEVHMHPMGILGPTDPQVTSDYNDVDPWDQYDRLPIEVEDVTSFIAFAKQHFGESATGEAFRVLTNRVHPLALGAVHRTSQQSGLLGRKLIRTRAPGAPELPEDVVEKLTTELFDHRHPINRREAQELGLTHVKAADPKLESLMWELYESYSSAMRQDVEFDPIVEARDVNPDALPGAASGGESASRMTQVSIDVAYVESATRSDCRVVELDVTIVRDPDGYDADFVETGGGWRVRAS